MDIKFKVIYGWVIAAVVIAGLVFYSNRDNKKSAEIVNQQQVVTSQEAAQSQDTPKYVIDYSSATCIFPDGKRLTPYSRCQDVKEYTSENLGVSFSVHESATITEDGNRIYIDGAISDEKDFVEIFEKPAGQTLLGKVKGLMEPAGNCRVINGYREAGFRDDGEYVAFPATYAGITLKASVRDESDSEPLQCENEFAVVNQNNLFLADSNIPTKIAFFNFRDGWIPSGEKLWWWQTFRFIK